MIFDSRSESNISSLLPAAQTAARQWLAACIKAGLTIRIIDGNRSYAQQDGLYAQGRSKPGHVVTNARGGYSRHNFGIAWDFGIFGVHGEYVEDGPAYTQAGRIAEAQGLEWGGAWEGFEDRPHVQLKTGLSLTALRAHVAQGVPVV